MAGLVELPSLDSLGIDGFLFSWRRQADQSVVVRLQRANGGVVLVVRERGREVQDAQSTTISNLAGCRNGRTRPAKGGEERRTDGWGEVRMTMDGERQGRRDGISLRETGAMRTERQE